MSFDVSKRDSDEIVITDPDLDTGSSSPMYCYGSADASTEGGDLPTLVEATCGDEDCFDMGEIYVACSDYSGGDGEGEGIEIGADTGLGGLIGL